MELRQLTYFLAIADCGSMSDASKQLHVSQPAISGALKDLETELGFSLFDRRGKRLHINQNGIYFAKHVRKIFATLDDVQETIKISIAQRENTIHCLVNTPLGTMGKTLFRGFHQANPEVPLQIGFAATTLFDSSACDIEIFGSAHDYPETNQLISLTHEDYVIAIPANHPLAHKSPLYLHDFKDEPFIFGEASEMRSTLELMFAQAGIKPLVAGEIQLYSDILQLVRAGVGCTFAAEHSWFDGYEDDELTIRHLDDIHIGRTIYARIPNDVVPSAATMKFFDYLKDHRAEFSVSTL